MILINKSYIISSPFSSFFKTSNGALSPRKGTGLHNHSLNASSEVCSLLPKDHIKSDTPSIGDFTSCPLKINSCLSVYISFFIDILFSYIDYHFKKIIVNYTVIYFPVLCSIAHLDKLESTVLIPSASNLLFLPQTSHVLEVI